MLRKPTPHPYRPHNPTWRQPLYLVLRPLWNDLSTTLASFEGRVLDVGCGLQPYRPLMTGNVVEYVGLDREGPLSNATVVGSANDIPFADETFDAILATQVFEHLPEPDRALTEVTRVLKPGGKIVLTVPGVWPAHEVPHDYWRFTRYGLEDLLQRRGLVVEQIKEQGRFWSTLGQMVNLELERFYGLRNVIPLINLAASFLDRFETRQKLVLNWFVRAGKPAPAS